MAITTLEEKFVHDLGDIYDAEHRFLEAQQEMLSQANADTVKMMLQQHISETEAQINNVEQVYEALGTSAKRIKCDAAAGLVTEGEKTLEETADNPAICDIAIVGAAAKVEHYEIASYRGLITAAQLMGQTDIMQLLQKNLQQEEQTAQKLEQSMPALIQKAMSQAASA